MVPAERPAHLLIWVRTGRARLLMNDGTEFHLADGEGIWMPPGDRNSFEALTDPGTVAFPYWPHASIGAGAPTEPTRFGVPDDWQDWLIQLFNLQGTPFSDRGYSPDAIARLLRRHGARPPDSGNPDPSTLLSPLTIPKAAGARTVAEELLRDPALDLTIKEWATRALSSPSTLLRGFTTGTGHTFEQWRLHCRLTAAVELLAAGYEVDQVAARVGFTSRGGFRRAFQQHVGMTPHEFAGELAARATTVDLPRRARAARQADDLTRLARGEGAPVAAPDLLPATRTPPHTNNFHVLSWMYRGSGYLDIGDHHYERERGVATWIPAGSEHITGLRENSISLPLGDASPADFQLAEPLQVRFSPGWDDYLMFCSISARSTLQPDKYDPLHILDLFAEQVATQRALSVPMPTNPSARSVAMDYLRRIGLSASSTAFEVPAEIHQAFHAETGMTFARWRYAARMRIARDLLIGGAKPSVVARRVGYAHLPTFSAAFTRFHGLSPREYQERERDSV